MINDHHRKVELKINGNKCTALYPWHSVDLLCGSGSTHAAEV